MTIPAGVAAAAADWLAGIAARTLTRRDRFRIALAGGSTPRALYRLLAAEFGADRVHWRAWEVFFGDERACPADDPGSNYRMAREALLDLVPIPAEQRPSDRGGACRPGHGGR